MDNNEEEKTSNDSNFDFDESEFPEIYSKEQESQTTMSPSSDIKEPVVEAKPITNQQNSIVTPSGEATRMLLTRLGIILSNLAIIFAVLSFLSIVGVFLSFFFYIILIMLVILTLFTILLDPRFRNLFSGDNSVIDFFAKLASNAPLFMGLSIACSIVSSILLLSDKHKKHTGRIVFSIISIAFVFLLVILFVLSLSSKGGTD